MAFQQPQQRPQAPRQLSFSKQVVDAQTPVSPARKRTLEESQEWILFSPAQNGDERSRTSQTPRTATHLSEFGSLETHVRSQPAGESAEEATCQGTEVDDENAELDSLDDGLHAFHHHALSSPPNHLDQSGGTLLPTHDGLGTFTSAAGLQEQLWQFERYNPHRRRYVRRRSSIQRRLDEVEEEGDLDLADERTARIEKWRLEQSKAVLEEIERETRRRQRRMSRMSGASASVDIKGTAQDDMAASYIRRMDSVIIEEPEPEPAKSEDAPSETWWRRLTRRVIQDLIGLDDNTLSVIFGEQLPEEPSPTPRQPSPLAMAAAKESRVTFHSASASYNWETKLLERIARELGILVDQLSEHEGAFSTYQRLRGEPEYAGLPMQHIHERQPSLRQRQQRANEHAQSSQSDALFTPTLPQAPESPLEQGDTSLWGIEEEPNQATQDEEEAAQMRRDREYWERDIDVNVIFSYLRRRFSSSRTSSAQQPEAAGGPLPASWTTNSASALGTSPESMRRAEMIRRQHPLVSRAAERAAAQTKRRDSLLRRHQMQSLLQKRPGSSSCASQSTKRSRHSRSQSSRHYWDLGGSVGSVGSGPAMSSGLGGWGEV